MGKLHGKGQGAQRAQNYHQIRKTEKHQNFLTIMLNKLLYYLFIYLLTIFIYFEKITLMSFNSEKKNV